MKIQVELELLTIIVEIFDGSKYRTDMSYAVLISKLTGQVWRLSVPDFCDALTKAAAWQRKHGIK